MPGYDLTATMMKYLDRHQILPLLEFLQENKLYNSKDLQKAKLDLVSKTKMVDFAIEEYKQLYNTEDVPAGMEEQRTRVYNELSETQAACGALLEIVESEDEDEERPSLDLLRAQKGVTKENVAALYPYAKLNFDCGRYQLAAKTLKYFRALSDDDEKKFWALWGKLASEILMVNCEVALEDLKDLRQEIDRRVFTDHFEQLQQRTWLVHWSLFIFFNLEGGLAALLEFLFQEKLINTIQTQCPHILRYIATAVVINKSQSRKNVLKDVVKILVSEEEEYSDPVTKFLVAIYSRFDFDKSRDLLKACKEVVETDFFMAGEDGQMAKQFMEGACLLVFETCCRIHKCISIETMGKHLNLEGADAESKIVQLIRESNMPANIDSINKQIIVPTQRRNAYQMVTDLAKSRNLEHRSNNLIQQVEKKYQLLDNES